MTKEDFIEYANANDFGGGTTVIIEDQRMGLINHWNDETVMVDMYRGNDLETVHVPWKNLIMTHLGIIVGLKGAIPA
jgi:hypothetical protein